jgi:D-lactate dehydrogenase
MVALRCAGFDRVDLQMTEALGITVARVPAYSPYAVAEHAVTLLLTLNRKIHKAYNRTREGNFSLDGLLGFDLFGKTAGIIGTGKIGVCLINILQGKAQGKGGKEKKERIIRG